MGPIALVGANVFVVFFAATRGPVIRVVLGELFPNRIRGLGLGIATAFNWIFNFLVTLLFPIMTALVGLGFVYAGFAFFAVLSVWFVAAFLQEVKGLELEDKNKLSRVRRQPRSNTRPCRDDDTRKNLHPPCGW